MRTKKKISWVVKTVTQSGMDHKVYANPNREKCVAWEFEHRKEYNFNLFIEKVIY